MIGLGTAPVSDGNDRNLLVDFFKDGRRIYTESLDDARNRHSAVRSELPLAALRISNGDPALETIILDESGSKTTNPYQSAPVVTNV